MLLVGMNLLILLINLLIIQLNYWEMVLSIHMLGEKKQAHDDTGLGHGNAPILFSIIPMQGA